MFIAPLLLLNMDQAPAPPPPPSFVGGVSQNEWQQMGCAQEWQVRTNCTISNPDNDLYRLELERDHSASGLGTWVVEDSDVGMVAFPSHTWQSGQTGDPNGSGAGDISVRFRWRIVRRSDNDTVQLITAAGRVFIEWGICV